MTQTERVRTTEQQIFSAESAAILKRVMLRVGERQAKRDQKVREWKPRRLRANHFDLTASPVATPRDQTPKPRRKVAHLDPADRQTPGPKPVIIARGGKSLTVKQWAETIGISIGAMRSRMTRLGSIEAAIDAGPRQWQPKACRTHQARGYQSISQNPSGTGGGSTVGDLLGQEKSQ